LRALLLANYIAWLGNGVTMVAVPIYVLARTGSTMAAGVAGAANGVPLIIAGVAGGVLVDRWGARRSCIAADLLAGLFTVAVPLLDRSVPLAAIVALLFLRSLLATPGNVARLTLLPILADRAGVRRQTANTLYQLAPRLALIAGPAVAGIAIASVGAATTLVVDAASFLLSAALVAAFVRRIGLPAADRPTRSFVGEMAAGFGFIRANRGLTILLAVVLAMNFIDEAYIPVLLPIYSRDVLSDPKLIGWLLGANGVGAVLGTVLYLAFGNRLAALRWATFIACLAVLAIARAGLAGLPDLAGASAMLFALGLASGPLNPIINTLVQDVTPAAMRGRVFGLIGATAYAAAPLGILGASAVVSIWGLHRGLMAFGTLYGLVFVAAWRNRALKRFADGPVTSAHAS